MKYIKVLSFLVLWYFGAIALFFATIHLMPKAHGYVFDVVFVTSLLVAAYIALSENFLTRFMGRLGAIVALVFLLWAGFMSCVYLGIFIFGDGL